jgi:hypothetical protein
MAEKQHVRGACPLDCPDTCSYYHNSRPHQALEKNSPTPREIEEPVKGKVIAIPQVGGLHHRYRRAA